MLPVGDTRTLALLFHLNSEPWVGGEASAENVYQVEFKELHHAEGRVVLPQTLDTSALLQVIGERTSTRAFGPSTMALTDLAHLLKGSYGLGRAIALPDGLETPARAVPSAGGLYPLELYALLSRVETIADGLYHYSVIDHTLERVRTDVDPDAFGEAVIAAPLLENANAVVFMSAVLDRTLRKYGPRGYRYILIEAGHVAQNLCLLATERGLASLCVGGFFDSRLNRVLDLEPRTELVVYCVAVGHATGGGGETAIAEGGDAASGL
jgi:SagB-type dehydrogenase family enzyme